MGNARCGKDTAYQSIKECVLNKEVHRVAFADELKKECDEFLTKNIGISAFTDDSQEKEIIRPFLVTYGTHLRRKLDPSCWIKKAELSIKDSSNSVHVVTDTRYLNEADWVKKKGGLLIYIEREGIEPANEEEEDNNPVLKSVSDVVIHMPTFNNNYFEKCRKIIKEKLKI